jgi:glycosyltransferase involved in cell wall biosynthesis
MISKRPKSIKLLLAGFILFLFISYGQASEKDSDKQKKAPTICLNMIVKNETKVIKRCLASVKPVIDYWVIVDTGSTDGTQEMIRGFMKDVPGQLEEVPWVNFEYNRNKALEFAKGKADYVLIIDADEVLRIGDGFNKGALDKDFYHIITEFGGTEYTRVQLIKNSLPWKWVGVLHEALHCPDISSGALLAGLVNVVNTDGARSADPLKYQKDAAILEEALKKEPDNSRYKFYLAQSYRDAGDYQKAIDCYSKYIQGGGWDQEVFWAMLQVARLQMMTKTSPETFLNNLYQAYHYRPIRAEPLYTLANYYRVTGNYPAGHLMAKQGASLQIPKTDVLFLEKWIYDYGLKLEQSICAYWIGNYEECRQLSLEMLANPKLPESVRNCVELNLGFSRVKLMEQYKSNQEQMNLKLKEMFGSAGV